MDTPKGRLRSALFFCAKVLPRLVLGAGKGGGKTLPLAVILTAALL